MIESNVKAKHPRTSPYAEITTVPVDGKATLNHPLTVHISIFDQYGHRYLRPSVKLSICTGSDERVSSRMAYLAEHGSKDLGTSTPYIGSDSGYITLDLWGSGVVGDDELQIELDGNVIGTLPYKTAAHL